MKRSRSAWLAIASAILAGAHADAARPRYGGTLRLQDTGVIRSLDPAAEPADGGERAARARILPLVFETLAGIDPAGGLRPVLATAWERDARGSQWRIHIRSGVTLHDGAILEPWHVASALRAADPALKVALDGDTVVIDAAKDHPELPWELTDIRYAIGVRSSSGEWIGSGPFRVDRVDARRLMLRANDAYWGGRPFVDAVQIEMGQPIADQVTNLEFARTDIVSVRPTDIRRLAQRGLRARSSRPLELFAIVFEPHRVRPADDRLRRALSTAIDRRVLCDVLLQHEAEPATALLPQWLSGYSIAESPATPSRPPRNAIAALPLQQRTVLLRVDAADPLAQAIADRIVVDAREAGIALTVEAATGLAPRPDARLVRVMLPTTTPDRTIAAVVAGLGARVTALATSDVAPPPGAAIEAVYRFERALLDHDVIVPVVHVPEVYGVGSRVESWSGPLVQPSGALDLANAWLRSEKPDRP